MNFTHQIAGRTKDGQMDLSKQFEAIIKLRHEMRQRGERPPVMSIIAPPRSEL